MNTRRFFPMFLLLSLLVQADISAASSSNKENVSEAITTLLATKQNVLLVKSDFSAQFDQLSNLYRLNDNQLLWLGKNHSLSTIEKALSLLAKADEDGLDPKDYDTEILRQNFELAATIPENAVYELAKFDTALSISLLRFTNDLHNGKVRPQEFGYPAEFGNKTALNAAMLIKQSLEQDTLEQIPEAAAPQYGQYRKLKQALNKYRKATRETNFQALMIDKPLRPGDYHPQIPELHRRLIALELLPPRPANPKTSSDKRYSKSLVEAVKEFQRANGLQVDGIIGQRTAELLNLSTEQKIQQIELGMERLRWLPDNINGPLIVVNIPAYRLWAFDSLNAPEMLSMKVIIGKALRNQTPVLFEQMKYLEFMPYWNIPRSIMTKEILPKLYNNWGYLQNQDIELVQVYEGNSGSWDNIFDDIKRGRVRARQRPGKKNPLGKVKFIFPNKADVYLHDTSTPSLFNRSRRDFSHGCVRVEKAEKLAEFVLGHQPNSAWNQENIREAMEGPKTRRVSLKNAIPVLFFYTTVFIDQDDRLNFYPDIYDQDAALEKALGRFPYPGNSSVLTARRSNSDSILPLERRADGIAP